MSKRLPIEECLAANALTIPDIMGHHGTLQDKLPMMVGLDQAGQQLHLLDVLWCCFSCVTWPASNELFDTDVCDLAVM